MDMCVRFIAVHDDKRRENLVAVDAIAYCEECDNGTCYIVFKYDNQFRAIHTRETYDEVKRKVIG